MPRRCPCFAIQGHTRRGGERRVREWAFTIDRITQYLAESSSDFFSLSDPFVEVRFGGVLVIPATPWLQKQSKAHMAAMHAG